MPSQPGTVLAIDLGTSSVKVLIVGPNGNVLARGQAGYPTIHSRPDHDEQRIDDWLDATGEAVRAARRFTPDTPIDAIAVTGQMHGTVLYDADGLLLHPAVIWSDRRATELLPDLMATLGSTLMETIGGPLGTGYLASTLAWFRTHRPQVWRHIARVALPVDAIVQALCGSFVTDASNAVSSGLLNAQTGQWDTGILDTLGIPAGWLPEIVSPGTYAGYLTARASGLLGLPAGVPVAPAGGDALAAAVGGGVLTSDATMVVVSTGAQVIRPTGKWTPEQSGRWHTWPSATPPEAHGDRWASVGALLNGGRAIDWIHRTTCPGTPVQDVLDSARTVPAGADGLLFLPYLAGERTPLLDPYMRGSVVGLSDRHEPRHLMRAVLEGVALAIAGAADSMSAGSSMPQHLVVG
ncbi:MAG TPA: FGGY family carbohydrate kinase, partial [Thermomicrobiales bacterium]|nr:FGGY family carbohydrate kinase [Thermomicrobiales bacterium]